MDVSVFCVIACSLVAFGINASVTFAIQPSGLGTDEPPGGYSRIALVVTVPDTVNKALLS